MSMKVLLLGPIFALAAWTVVMLLLIAFRRFRAGFAGQLQPRDFALGESRQVPVGAQLANRNYMNLLELPVLFYVVCLLAIAFEVVTPATVAVAWIYVALRVVHSLVHVTYNHVIHRFAVFVASNVVLVALWGLVAVDVLVAA